MCADCLRNIQASSCLTTTVLSAVYMQVSIKEFCWFMSAQLCQGYAQIDLLKVAWFWFWFGFWLFFFWGGEYFSDYRLVLQFWICVTQFMIVHYSCFYCIYFHHLTGLYCIAMPSFVPTQQELKHQLQELLSILLIWKLLYGEWHFSVQCWWKNGVLSGWRWQIR